MDISDKDAQDMEKALRSVGEAKLGKGIYIDKIQNQIPDHLHWHARPFNWIPDRIKHKAPDDPEILMWKAKR
jgi:diadenosine tetraphosphate (Ap4A) HIT family hydrolase